MRTLFIKPRAKLDLLEIWHFIASDNIDAAVRVGDELDAAILGLLKFPGKGHSRRDVQNRRLRFWNVYSYVITYRYDDNVVTILRVLHGRRNLRHLVRNRF